MPVVSIRRSKAIRAVALSVALLLGSALLSTGFGAAAASAVDASSSLTIHLVSTTGKAVTKAEIFALPVINGAVSLQALQETDEGGPGDAEPVDGHPGTFEADGLTAGEYTLLLIGFDKEITFQFLGGSLTPDGAKYVTLNAGTNTISTSFAAAGTISGTVKNAAGKGVGDVCVDADAFDGTGWQSSITDGACFTQTNSSGKYTFNPGPAGSYKLRFTDSDGRYLTQYANGSATEAGASPIYLTTDKSAVVNTTLKLGGTLTGTVLGASHKPVDADLTPWVLTGNPTDGFTGAAPYLGSGFFGNDSETNSHGKFAIGGLPTGYYALGYEIYTDDDSPDPVGFVGDTGAGVLHSSYYSVTAGAKTTIPTAVLGPVTTPTGGIHLKLTSGGQIVLGEQDFLAAFSADGDEYDVTHASNGFYDFTGLPAGTYDVIADVVNEDDGELLYEPAVTTVTVGTAIETPTLALSLPNPISFTTDPSIDTSTPGTVGGDLVADPGAVNKTTADSTIAYQWYDVDSDGNRTLIRGAQSAHFTPRAGDLGKSVEARVTQTYILYAGGEPLYGESVNAFTNLDAITGTNGFENPTPPSLDPSQVKVGSEVDANDGVWTPSGASYTYQWFLDDSTTPIEGATGSSYTPIASDLGKKLAVEVTPHRAGYVSPAPARSEDETVAAGDAPTVTKAPAVSLKNNVYTATPGTWSTPASELTFSYDWTVDGNTEDNGGLATFTPTAPGAVAVTVTAHDTSDAYQNGTTTVLASKGTLPTFTASALDDGTSDAVTSSSPTEIGSSLLASLDGSPTFPDGSAITPAVQWQRETGKTWKNISGATTDVYELTLADLGHHLRARFTITSDKYATETVYAAGGIGAPGEQLEGVGTATLPEGVTLGGTVPVSLTGYPAGVKFTYQWGLSTDAGATFNPIPKATKSTLKLVAPIVAGDEVQLEVTASEKGALSQSIFSSFTNVLDTTVRLSGPPVITPLGGVKAGSTATATPGTADISGVTYSYQWFDGGAAISGAKSKTYKTPTTDVGDSLTVKVIGHKSGYADSEELESAAEAVLAPSSVKISAEDISLGTVAYGDDVTAPAPGDAFDIPSGFTAYTIGYQWKLDGKSISKATKSTYSPKTGDVGKKLSLTMTIKSDVYGTTSTTSPGAKVGLGAALPLAAEITASGPVVPGATLGVALTPADVASPTYQWQRSTDGSTWTAISKATHSTYLVQPLDAGTSIRIEVTSKTKGRANSVADATSGTVDFTGTIAWRVAPTISSPQVGVAATVATGTWNQTGLTFGYQWLLDGVEIPGATGATFTPLGSDQASDLSVRVTASRPGYESDAVESDSEEIAIGAAPTAVTKPAITGTAATCHTLSVSSGVWSVKGLVVTFQWQVPSAGGPVTVSTGSTYTPASADIGKSITVVLTAKGIGYATGTATTLGTKAVVAGLC